MSVFQKIRCGLYRAYDWSKDFPPIRLIFFRWRKYQHFNYVATTGKIVYIKGGTTDGDWTFDIQTAQGPIHCEVTPCFRHDRSILPKLAVGQTVWVAGTRTYDPTHLGTPGHWEIHPVESVRILA